MKEFEKGVRDLTMERKRKTGKKEIAMKKENFDHWRWTNNQKIVRHERESIQTYEVDEFE